jgi:hypothetical protein
MASKDEYYQRIIASLQADIKSQNSAITDLKSTVAGQQQEIETLKASQGVSQQSSEPHFIRLNVEKLLVEVKRVCDQAILTNYEHLPTMFADRQEFESYRKSSKQKFLTVDTLTSYQKSLETRLKSIEARLGSHYSLLTINRHYKNGNNESKSYFNLNAIIRAFKNENYKWLWAIIASVSIAMFAVSILRSITT